MRFSFGREESIGDLASNFYETLSTKRKRISILLLFFLFSSFVFFLITGSYGIDVVSLVYAIFGKEKGTISHIVWQIRIPRLLGTILSGAGLGLCGCVLQNVLKNPLVSPSTLGLTQGAAFGASFAIIFLGAGMQHRTGEGVTIFSYSPVIACAFCGSMAAMLLIYAISSLRGATREVVVLAGVAISSFFSALTMFIQYFAEDVQVAASLFWTFGDVGKATWKNVPILLAFFIPCFIYLLIRSGDLNALKWGDDVAKTLGVRPKTLRIHVFLISSLLSAVITSFLGIIAFVGLLSPHIGRLFLGEDERFLVPASALIGAFILVVSDILARRIIAPNVLPVGIVTSFFGAPFFVYLLLRYRHGNFS
ncbi:MAG: iron ABC transporter permease [Desulfobacterota bacterium]|nr:iron ABC transporter permease [Thermodesulfobacteriota bacterium]MDW8001458.1 iron ABC transporter permease [Deltaproteobacteria bacterium]